MASLLGKAVELEYRHYHDELTEAYNERFLQRHTTGEAVLSLNLDNFRSLNDTLGKQAGDTILRQFCIRMQLLLQEDDLLFRMNGDEFLLVLEKADHLRLERLTHQLPLQMETPFWIGTEPAYISVSGGISARRTKETSLDAAVRRAGSAMKSAKQSGKDQVLVYETMPPDQHGTFTGRLAHDLQPSLYNNEFYLQYQPKVDAESGRMVGAEALLRWAHPAFGAVRPDVFLQTAEKTGRMYLIDRWVINEACSQLSELPEEARFPVAVNVSSFHQHADDLLFTIEKALERTKLEPALLEIELTEFTYQDSFSKLQEFLYALRNLGVSVALDDFGTGHASLTYVQELPLTTLKLDRSFIWKMDEDETHRRMVDHILSIASLFSLQVVAEGVETKEQWTMLQERGCGVLQGFYFSRPVSFPQLLDYKNEPPRHVYLPQ
ncbi:hypothetical protein C6I21_01645 [Alkalicoccus urumqiensis]|uniref:Diguanylate cyclase n=2 Tax=Alkalicoccus urumqiensis TaxID=1548213 RepID=A0A2P6MM08_ALKUR|nr:hypothetical protein C6I21_01645 [Alkalicoccus urumqiensis]